MQDYTQSKCFSCTKPKEEIIFNVTAFFNQSWSLGTEGWPRKLTFKKFHHSHGNEAHNPDVLNKELLDT